MKQFGPQEIANLAWSFANLQFVDAPLLHALSRQAIAKLGAGSTQNLTNTAWAFAVIKFKNSTLFNSLAKEVIAPISAFRPRDISITAWAFARREVRDDNFLDAIAAAAIAKSHEFNGRPQELSNLAWAEAPLDLRHRPLLESLAPAAMRTSPLQFSSQELTNLAWSYAALKFCHDPLMQAIAPEAMPKITATQTFPEDGCSATGAVRTQNLVNSAWALDTLGLLHTGGRSAEGVMRQVLQRFLSSCQGSLGVEWVTLAAIVERHGLATHSPEFMEPFRARVLQPVLERLRALRTSLDDSTLQSELRGFQDWIVQWQVPHLGGAHTYEAVRAASAVPVDSPEAAWVARAREAVNQAAWWSCPHAMVSSQGVVAWLAADLEVPGGARVQEPGTVHFADDSAEHSILVERMLQPIYLQVPRGGHAERRALIGLLRSVSRQASSEEGEGRWMHTRGNVELFASHYLCISCLAVLAQFTRRLPRAVVEVACDNAWEKWEERTPPADRGAAAGAGAVAVFAMGRAG